MNEDKTPPSFEWILRKIVREELEAEMADIRKMLEERKKEADER